MDYPHGHQRTHHGRREEEDYPAPPHAPPPFYGGNEPPPPFHGRNDPPPPFYGGNEPPPPFHGRNDSPPPFYGGAPPPPFFGGPPPPPQVYHSSHNGPEPDYYQPPPPPFVPNFPPPPSGFDNPQKHHPQMPHFPPIVDHQTNRPNDDEIARKPSVRMYSKAEPNYSLTIRDGKVILAHSNPSDPFQHWVKDERFSTRVKDEQGYPSFALVNKATGQAMKHSLGATKPVQLVPYNANAVDESVLWTESKDLGDGYRTIRMVNNIKLNVDALNGDKNHGGVHDGTTIVLWEWKKGDNQRWKIVPY